MQTATSGMQTQFETKSREIEELQEQLQRERKRAITDPLTGLYNRFALIDQLNAAIGEMPDGPSALPGHARHRPLQVDQRHPWSPDRRPRHPLRRTGAAEEHQGQGHRCALRWRGIHRAASGYARHGRKIRGRESIRNAVANAQLVRADNKKPLGKITISAGVATYQAGEDVMEFINRADQALYRSKNEGRNRRHSRD